MLAVAITTAVGWANDFASALVPPMIVIDVAGMGIAGLRPKRAVAGNLVMEIPGAGADEKATELRDLTQALQGTGVRVACSHRRAELRVSRLTGLAPEAVMEVLVTTERCERGDVLIGDIRKQYPA